MYCEAKHSQKPEEYPAISEFDGLPRLPPCKKFEPPLSPSISSTLCWYDSRITPATQRASVFCKRRELALGPIGLEGECRGSIGSGRVDSR